MDMLISRINIDETIFSSDDGVIASCGNEVEITCLIRNGPTLAEINLCVAGGDVVKKDSVPDYYETARRELHEMFKALEVDKC